MAAAPSLQCGFDPASGETLMEHDASRMPGSSRLMFEWIFPTHTGDIAGATGRLLMFVSGLAPLVLFVTGLCVWFYKRRQRSGSASVAVP